MHCQPALKHGLADSDPRRGANGFLAYSRIFLPLRYALRHRLRGTIRLHDSVVRLRRRASQPRIGA